MAGNPQLRGSIVSIVPGSSSEDLEHSPFRGLEEAWTLPTELRAQLASGTVVELFYAHVPFANEFDSEELAPIYDRIMQVLVTSMHEFLTNLGCPFGVQRWPADDIVAWLVDSPLQDRRPSQTPEVLEAALSLHLREALSQTAAHPRIRERLSDLSVARAHFNVLPGRNIARGYARALRKAQQGACDPIALERKRCLELMDRALGDRAFTMHFQPIVHGRTNLPLAQEALCRGTMSGLQFPDVIFATAERCDRIWDLGRLLRNEIANTLTRFDDDSGLLLFMNCHPRDIEDPVFLEQALSGELAPHASKIVVELTERAAIQDYRRVKEFFSTLRRHGFRLAIDDLGSGYAGLTALAELEPEFIKFDMALVRDLHLHPVKQHLITRMNQFAREIGAQTISEGVECAEERDALLEAGCEYMQGYFFARPSAVFYQRTHARGHKLDPAAK